MMQYIYHEDGTLSALRLLLTIWLTFYIGRMVYRVWFHPLAKFPGPRLAAATHLYEIYYELIHKGGAQFTPNVRKLHSIYGPIIRINPDEISINDAQFHDKLYAPQPAVRDRHPSFSASLGTTKGSFSTPDHWLHRNRRAAYTQFFSWSNVMASESVALKKVHHLCNILSSKRDRQPNFGTYFAALSFDSFFTWAFGSSLELLDNLDLAGQCNETVELLVTASPVYRILPSVMYLARKIPRVVLRHLSRHIDQVFDLGESAEQFVATECASSAKPSPRQVSPQISGPETLFSAILRSQAPKEEKSPDRMAQEGFEMFMASFTPGRTMILGMYYILSHPQVHRRLRAELDYVNPDLSQRLTYQKLNNIPYLRAVLKEILRITFPIGARLPLICHEDIDFHGWTIPAYTAISVNHRTLLLDPTVFPSPLEFKPERWLESEHPIDEKRHFVGFGKGARSCPGKDFATNLVQLTLATLLQRFDFEIIDTIWERDVAVSRESTLTAPSFGSNGVKLKLLPPTSDLAVSCLVWSNASYGAVQGALTKNPTMSSVHPSLIEDGQSLTDPSNIDALLCFWFDHPEGLEKWFKFDPAIDDECRAWECWVLAARSGYLFSWAGSPNGALALLILLDQIPRNIYRGTPKAYASDMQALELALGFVAHGLDLQVPLERQMFYYLPILHQESLMAQLYSVGLYQGMVSRAEPGTGLHNLLEGALSMARKHLDIIIRFGRFPKRNSTLGRESTREEAEYLKNGATGAL
ncbi:hypothetical protein CHU98_g8202 [Xylaria longipes]|nr:hypothetical protein CHU98_g8202 [Xylaria longipes]